MKAAALVLIIFIASAFPAFSGEYAGDAYAAYQYKSKIYGVVEQIVPGTKGRWIVDGREVIVTPDTRIEEKHGKAAVGAFVEVKGVFSGREFIAKKIEVKRDSSHARIYGVIEKIPQAGFGIWTIDGKRVFVDDKTEFDEEYGRAVVGAYVEVKGSYSANGFSAREIEVKRASRRR